jgi:GT2 family glycosyltransferase
MNRHLAKKAPGTRITETKMTERAGLPAVVVPVYNAADDVDCCLASLWSTMPQGGRVIVIDDASPDPAVQRLLDHWRRRCGADWVFTANQENRGFVGTANRGLEMAGGDVVLLNSDTIVTPGWLQGLGRCLASDPAIATATPWTNNGEIVSIPHFCANNPLPPDPAAVSNAILGAGKPAYPELPTAVGFCMAISGRAVERIGRFDEALFGKGYGEENDFSVRAIEAGMRNVLCDDVYVAHRGGSSFGPTGLKPNEESMARLLSRHPQYLERVQAFIAADPLAPRRGEVLDALRRSGAALG